MRLIDADELKDFIFEMWGGDPMYHTARHGQLKTETEAKAEYACLMRENIDAQPTVEAEPKHGRWIYIRDEENNGLYECSECHKGDIHAKECEVPYCWNCGARMDQEEKDG